LKILITGPESSGKSFLARALAWALDGRYVAEEARAYLNALDREYHAADLPRIWQLQHRAETIAVATGASFVVCDTGPEVIKIWAEVKYGNCPTVVEDAFRASAYDLVFLCSPDLPWQPDPLREAPDEDARQSLFHRYSALLPDAIVVSGPDRVAAALAATLHAVSEEARRRQRKG